MGTQAYLVYIAMGVIIIVAVVTLFLFYRETRRTGNKEHQQNLGKEPLMPSLRGVAKKEEPLMPSLGGVVKKEEPPIPSLGGVVKKEEPSMPSLGGMSKPKDELKSVLEKVEPAPAVAPQEGKGLPQGGATIVARVEAKAPEPAAKKETPVPAKKKDDVMSIFTSEEGESRPLGSLAADLEDVSIRDILDDCRSIAGRLGKAR